MGGEKTWYSLELRKAKNEFGGGGNIEAHLRGGDLKWGEYVGTAARTENGGGWGE